MSNRPPAFQFYPKDFLADANVQMMTFEERGKYTTLLCMCWIEDGLKIGWDLVEDWFNQHPTVRRCFVKKGGKYRNPRLDLERQKQIDWQEKSKKGGLHSAEKRRLRTKGQPGGNQRSTKGQPRVNSSVFSLQSSSSIKDSLSKGIFVIPKNLDFKIQDQLREIKADICKHKRLLNDEVAMRRVQKTKEEIQKQIEHLTKIFNQIIEDRK